MFDYSYLGDPRMLPSSVLAYIGDAVFELYTRLYVINNADGQIKSLHHRTIKMVNAKSQANYARDLLDKLSENELQIFKRGRNTHSKSMAKNADPADYQVATGFETLIGYLYLNKEEDRLKEIFELIGDFSICKEEK